MSKRVVRTKKGAPIPPKYKGRVREFTLGSGLPSPEKITRELKEYRDVLAGRADPPIQKGVATMLEVAEAYFSRACDIEQDILIAAREGRITKSSPYHSIRTQEIRSFKEQAKSAAELGSRRITWENLRYQQELRGLESL